MRISREKKDRISEQILAFLYASYPQMVFTSNIAREIARDEEFVKSLLLGLKKKNLVVEVKKNQKGVDYSRRLRWKLGDEVYAAYKKHQQQNN
ncbi:MAG TPA: hypothetical protein VJ208_04165 [Candidatus Nanoarchaeia archaeon]|nr:hypothetical protein [Candidatus Nanoarchaeia archaeon]